EEKLHNIEEAAQEKLHDIGERLHLTSSPDREEKAKEKIDLKTRKKTIDS
nr:hypothetical protein [Acidobacteriota bacterium]